MGSKSSNCLEKSINSMGAFSLTCLNPWQGLGAPKIDPKNGQKWPKMHQNGSKSSFVGPNGSKKLELPGKKLKQYGGIQPDLFEPMAGAGWTQKRQKVGQNAPEWLKK